MFSSQARYGAQHGETTKKKNICGKSGSALKHIQLEKKQIHAQKTPITLFL